jgi:hypothetical protein
MIVYQAIFDAVRSKLSNGDVGEAIKDAIRDAGIAHYVEVTSRSIAEDFSDLMREQARPSVLYRPVLTLDGNAWCVLYGPDLQIGVAGFGTSPAEAMTEFDKAWVARRKEGST